MKFEKYRGYIAAGITAFLVLAAAILTYFLFDHAKAIVGVFKTIIGILTPFIIGGVLAYLLSPLYNFLTRNLDSLLSRRLKKPGLPSKLASGCSVLLSVLAAFLVVYALLAMVIPGFINSIMNEEGLLSMLPAYIRQFSGWLDDFLASNPELEQQIQTIYSDVTSQLLSWLQSKASDFNSLTSTMGGIGTLFSGVFVGVKYVINVVANTAIGIVVACYLLPGKGKLISQAKKIVYSAFKPAVANRIVFQCRYIHQVFGGFIRGKLLDSLIIGALCFIGTSILNTPYPLVVSVVVGVTNIIPFFGPIIGAVPCTLLILLVSPFKAIWFVVFIIALQQLDGNIIGPRILGETTGLSSFWVLFSILLFGGLWGFVGMIIAVPLFAVIYSIVDSLVCVGLKKRGLSVKTADYFNLDHMELPQKTPLKMQDPTKKQQ